MATAAKRELREVLREQVGAYGDAGGVMAQLLRSDGGEVVVRVAVEGLTFEQLRQVLNTVRQRYDTIEKAQARRRQEDGDGEPA